jgi:NAD(P)-dependent dehydrogenase (short-subunit alcohol dehydrogenase family)
LSVLLTPEAGSRIAVVGACGGIGRAVVAALRACSVDVVMLDLAASLAGEDGIAVDVADRASVTEAFARVAAGGALHGLVNLAGFASARVPVMQADPADWDEVIGVNLTGAFHLSKAALPLLREAAEPGKPSTMVHVASGLAARLLPGYGPYGASKAGLIALTKSIAVENAPLVRANAVAPGAVQTEFLQGGMGRATADGALLDVTAYARSIPMGRIAEPDDVAGPIVFLLSPASGFMTGQVLWVNGGAYTP